VKGISVSIQQIKAADTWKLRQEVMWPNMPLSYVKLSNDEKGVHFGLFLNEKLQGVGSLFIDQKDIQLRKLAVRIPQQGKGYGKQLLSHLISYSQKLQIESIWCNARTDKLKFYESFDFVTTEKRFLKNNQSYCVVIKNLKNATSRF